LPGQDVYLKNNDNGYNPKYSITTDMKGITVKPVYIDGSKADAEWRVTRRGPKKFDLELPTHFGGWKDEYEVSDDGTNMTMDRCPTQGGIVAGKVDSKGVIHGVDHIFVFEKMK
jgi:hypothetical protein